MAIPTPSRWASFEWIERFRLQQALILYLDMTQGTTEAVYLLEEVAHSLEDLPEDPSV